MVKDKIKSETTSQSPNKNDGGEEEKKESEESKNEKKIENELSPEDEALKERLEVIVERLQEADDTLHSTSLEHLSNEIKDATSSMTSVPKPLKFLKPHFDTLKNIHELWEDESENKRDLSDILSVLAMTMSSDEEGRESLQFKLQGTLTELSSWGHEYMRALSGEISQEYTARVILSSTSSPDGGGLIPPYVDDLMMLVDDIVPHHMSHNAEAEAVDLLLEVQQLPKILGEGLVDSRNASRVCLYILRCTEFMGEEEDLSQLLNTAYQIYLLQNNFSDAMRVAMRMDDDDKVLEIFKVCDSSIMRAQLCYLISLHTFHVDLEPIAEELGGEELVEIFTNMIGNTKLSEYFLASAQSLDMMPSKSPEDIYKTHLVEGPARWTRRSRESDGRRFDSARDNLASTFVNALVNCAFCSDSLLLEDDSDWLHRNRDHGMMSVSASIGLLMLWNVEDGLIALDKYLYSNDDFVKAGGCLSVGIVTTRVRDESDAAMALLSEYVESSSESHIVKCAATLGLGIAYSGTRRDDAIELLLPIVSDSDAVTNMVEVGLAALAVGMICVGTCDEDACTFIIMRLMECTEQNEVSSTFMRFLSLGLSLLFLGKQDKCEAMLEVIRTIEHEPTRKYAEITLETCAYAGTGNVLKIQQLLHHCSEHLTENAEHQALSVLGIALIACGEKISTEMSLRTFDHLLHYCELPIKRAVPLALGLLYISHPDYSVIDQLSRLSHDVDTDVALGAVFSLGLVSAGTNNSRVAQLLRSLSDFYSNNDSLLFCVRLAQGLNALGKGLLTLHPQHSDRLLLQPSSLASILVILHAALDIKGTILDKYHYLLFAIAPAISPRLLMTLEKEVEDGDEEKESGDIESIEEMKLTPVNVRVGQAVEIVGQAGKPRAITGFQTHMTPVQMGVEDKAELEAQISIDPNKGKKSLLSRKKKKKKEEEERKDEEYESLTNVLEGVVIVRKKLVSLRGDGDDEEKSSGNPNEDPTE